MIKLAAARDWDRVQIKVEKIADLTFDYRLYPRKEMDRQLVKTYANALAAGSVFPSAKVALFNGEKIVVDGFHRAESRILLKIDYVDCSILPFESEAEMFAEAVRLNSGHGRNFTELELKANIKRLQKYKFDIKDIVAFVHVPAADIQKETAAPITTLTTPSGKKIVYHADPAEERHVAMEHVEEESDATVKEIIRGTAEEIDKIIKLKNALLLVGKWAESGHIPNYPGIKEIVGRVRLALGKVQFDD